MNELFYQIALIKTPKIGCITSKKLVDYFGSAQNLFAQSIDSICASKLINLELAKELLSENQFRFAEEEIKFIEKYQIQALAYNSANYPKRLSHFEDSPFLLFYKGSTDLNNSKVVAVVGTRKPTDYGRQICEQLVEDLKHYNPLIVSGLAYGIDGAAHQKCLDIGLSTVAVLAHGLDRIYPPGHKKMAQNILENGGGLLSEYPSRTEPIQSNFPTRNRIVAGMTDALVVVETADSGGSMISAYLANEYQKDVFAFPGRIGDNYSKGCNHLIKTHKAALIESAEDIAYIMRWNKEAASIQKQLFVELSQEERRVTDLLLGQDHLHLDQLIQQTGISTSRIATILLELEMRSVLRVLPGKYYRLS